MHGLMQKQSDKMLLLLLTHVKLELLAGDHSNLSPKIKYYIKLYHIKLQWNLWIADTNRS